MRLIWKKSKKFGDAIRFGEWLNMKEYRRAEEREYIDIAKGIAISCVILSCFIVSDIPEFLHRINFSFHMPLFFIIAGYFFRKKDMTSLVKAEGQRLLAPYVYCSMGVIFFLILWKFAFQISNSTEPNILEWVWAFIYGSGNEYTEPFWIKNIGIIWLLPAMFWSLLLFNFCIKRKVPLIWISICTLIGYYTKEYFWLPFSLQSSLLSITYLYVGYWAKKIDFLSFVSERPYRIVMVFLLWAFYLISGGGNLNLAGGYFENGLLYDLFFSSAAVFCVIYLSRVISDRKWKIKRIFLFFGKNSLKVLCICFIETSVFQWNIAQNFLEYRGIHGYWSVTILFGLKVILAVMGVKIINFVAIKNERKRVERNTILCRVENILPACVNLSFEKRQSYLLLGITLIFLVVGELSLSEQVKHVTFSFHIPLIFAVAGYIWGRRPSKKALYRYAKISIGAYGVCRIGYLAVQLWNSVFYSAGADGVEILKDWMTVTFWGMSNSSTILPSVKSVGLVWILPSVLISGIIGAVIIRLVRTPFFQAIAVASFSIMGMWMGHHIGFLPFSLDVSMACVPLIWTGYMVRNQYWRKKIEQPRCALFFAICWLFLVKWGGLDLEVRSYPNGIIGIFCSVAACIVIINIVKEFPLPDVLRIPLEWGGKHFVIFLGIHCIVRDFAPWATNMVSAPIMIQLLVEILVACAVCALSVLIKHYTTCFLQKNDWRERIYLFILGAYFARVIFDTTMFQFSWPVFFYPVIRVAALIIAWNNVINAKWDNRKNALGCLIVAVIFCFSFTMTGYEFLFDLGILLLGAVGVSGRKIVKVYFICVLVVMYLALIASLTGCIPELVYKEGELYKHSFGICYPTDFAAHLVYMMLAFWVVFKKIPSIIPAIIMAGLTVTQLVFCGTQCSEIVMALSILCVIYVAISQRVMRENKILRKLIIGVDKMVCMTTIICAVVIITLSIKYNPDIPRLEQLNQILSNRLLLAQNAFQQYGISLFGTTFEMIGNGSGVVSRTGYNFIDSSFCLILIRYGILPFGAVLLISVLASIKALRTGNRRIVFALALIAVHSMIEHHLMELAYNPFLLLTFCNMNEEHIDQVRSVMQDIPKIKKKILSGTVCGIISLILLGAAPAILTYGRTLVTLLRFYEAQRQLWFIFALLILTAAVVVLAKNFPDLCIEYRKTNNLCGTEGHLVTGSILIIVLSLGIGEWTIRTKATKYEQAVTIGKQLIEKLNEELEGLDYKIYVDDIPTVYQREVVGVSNRIFPAVGRSNEENIIMITDKNEDVFRLTEAGFQFGELSEMEGIYADNQRAIQVIEENGISMEKCYSVMKTVDLANLASLNDLELKENGSLIVDGQEKSLIYGPYDVIYQGILRVTFQLKLLDSSIEEGEVATVRLSTDFGKKILQQKTLNRGDFDQNGVCTATIANYINNSEGVEFLVFANGDTEIEVESITYRKVEE